ncbi:hypothetical protein Ciccas_009554, partial [Cichlidogyrus casuarinus]
PMTKLECDSVKEALNEPCDSSDDLSSPTAYSNMDPERLGYMPIDTNNTNVYSSSSDTDSASESISGEEYRSENNLGVNAELQRILDSAESEISPSGNLDIFTNISRREFDNILTPEEDVASARDIDLNAEKKSTILNLMNEVKLPPASIPEWARSLDEKSLLEAIQRTCKR